VGSDFEAWDWKRIFIGDAPYEFLIEVLIRTIIMYILLLIIVRLMGSRISGQFSVSDMSVIITLGAITSPGMQAPEKAILYSTVALLVIYLLHKLVSRMATKNEKFLKVSEGSIVCLVKDGKLQLDAMRRSGVTRQELFAELRNNKIDNLSKVDRIYLEACGIFSIFAANENREGLVVFPEKDRPMLDYYKKVNSNKKACANCGNVQPVEDDNQPCSNCGEHQWHVAYM